MKRLATILTFLIAVGAASSGFAANTEGWVKIKRKKGITVPAPGVTLTPSTIPTNAARAEGNLWADDANNTIKYYNGSAYVDLGVQAGAALDLDGAFDNGKIINGANSGANAVQVGDGTDAILMHTEGAGDVRITTNGTSDLIIAPDGGDTNVTGTLDVSGAATTGDFDVTTTDTSGNGVFVDGSTITSGDVLQLEADAATMSGGLIFNCTQDTVSKFSVNEDGDTTIAGTLDVTGLATLGSVTVSSGGLTIIGGISSDVISATGNITSTAGDLKTDAGEVDVVGGASNEDLVDITRSNSATGGGGVDIAMGTGATSGHANRCSWSGAGTGDGYNADMTNNVSGSVLAGVIAGVRTDDGIKMTSTSTGADNIFGAYLNGAATGKVLNLDMNLGITAEGLAIDNGGTARTGSDIHVTGDSTGTHSVVDIDDSGSGALTGYDYVGSFNGSPGGDAIKVNFNDGDNLDTGVLDLTIGTGARSALITYVGTQTDSGTTSYVYDHLQSGILDSAFWHLKYDTAASTGDGLFMEMGTNVAGRAIAITSVGTGVDDEGVGAHIAHTGNLVQGANVARFTSTGDMAGGQSAIVEIVGTGASQAGSTALSISSTNNDAIEIVSGNITLTTDAKIVYRGTSQGVYSQAASMLDLHANSAVRIGDSSAGAPTNYTNISSTGSITLVGSARETKTIWIPAQAFQNVSGAAQAVVGIAGIWQLSDAASDSLTATFYVPNGYVEGTNMTAKVHWSSAQISNTATFDGAYLAAVAGEDTSAAGTLFTQEDDAASGTADFLNITEGFSIANGDIDKGDQVILNIIRLGSDGNDDLTDDADFHGVAITYTADRI